MISNNKITITRNPFWEEKESNILFDIEKNHSDQCSFAHYCYAVNCLTTCPAIKNKK